MPRGGWRPGAGRKSGSVVKRKANAIVEEAIKAGLTPLEYMLNVMKDENADQRRRDQMAIAAAPFCHPKLATVNTTLNSSPTHIGMVKIVTIPSGAFVPASEMIQIKNDPPFLDLEPNPELEPEAS